ncbi:MAG: hypothetical protein KGL35_08815, partial [Bradyrhizobium sp.]|nr:hypothetical protein [Bradyrhizobium sp.]
MTSASLLTLVGQALNGPEFRSALARRLGVARREVERWAAGTAPVPPGVWRDLADLIEEDLADLLDARVMLDANVLSV